MENYQVNDTAQQPSAQVGLQSGYYFLKRALSFYGKHFGPFVAIGALPFLLSLASTLFGPSASELSGASVIISIVIYIASILLYMLAYFALVSYTAEQVSVGAAFGKAIFLFVSLAWVSFLAVLASIGGAVVFIIPGIIVQVLLTFSVFVLVSENRRGIDALLSSWHYVRGHAGSVFLKMLFIGFATLIIMLVMGGVLLGIGYLVLGQNVYMIGIVNPEAAMGKLTLYGGIYSIIQIGIQDMFILPVTIIYFFLIYQSLRAIKGDIVPGSEEERNILKKLKIFFILGALGVVAIVSLLGFMFFIIFRVLMGGGGSLMPGALVLFNLI